MRPSLLSMALLNYGMSKLCLSAASQYFDHKTSEYGHALGQCRIAKKELKEQIRITEAQLGRKPRPL